jgi:hypothetical protein
LLRSASHASGAAAHRSGSARVDADEARIAKKIDQARQPQ